MSDAPCAYRSFAIQIKRELAVDIQASFATGSAGDMAGNNGIDIFKMLPV